MIETMKAIVGWMCLAFSILGAVELAIGFWETKTYNLMRAIVYCGLFGIAMGLLH